VRKSVNIPISIDTTSARVAAELIDAGADMVNDISGMQFDPDMAAVVAERECPVVLMHIQGTPRTMQKDPRYEDVISDIYHYFQKRIYYATRHGISEQDIILDPGIGFGKKIEHNYRIIRRLSEFRTLNKPLLIGASRKSFIGTTLDVGMDERLEGSLAVAAVSIMNGAGILRVHDVQATVRVARMVDAITQVQETV
jgi:dihydropteroate synthase